MLNISRNCICLNIPNIQLISRYAHRVNHYEVLKLNPSCTSKEIRDAFIRLSKELHPDAKSNSSKRMTNEKSFVQLLDAYKILSKPETRASYDHELFLQTRTTGKQAAYQSWQPNTSNYPKPDPESYYGIKGIRRVSNWKIMLICFIFMLFGVSIQMIAINKSFTFNRDQLDDMSRKNAIMHAEVRAEAESRGNDAQIERMKAQLNKETLW
ncbi:dnaJ-like protein 60 isoform X2 [Sabethes cyaneus]|uniref:dnaJ-like protein 60 isoform X2 n=1 Tax=Sabethes cyaneus TaxID=53552 RepID=UPI00237D5216|nr:dnaJ-like protein 60 isoform X2 [Sabethes cyaneus]